MNNNKLSELSQSSEDGLPAVLKDKAYRLLACREYSMFELRKKIATLAPFHICEQVLLELVDQGVQSDKRFAEMLCRSRFNAGKGPVKLKFELNEHNIDSTVIETMMAVYESQWAASANQVRSRKFGDTPPADFKEWAKQARFLQQRGFTSLHIGHFEKPLDE